MGSCCLPAAWLPRQLLSCRALPAPGLGTVAGGCRLGGVLSEQLPGEGDFHPGVWVQTQREDGGRAYNGAPLPPLHHARYGGGFPRGEGAGLGVDGFGDGGGPWGCARG